jgi:hypothetical protein
VVVESLWSAGGRVDVPSRGSLSPNKLRQCTLLLWNKFRQQPFTLVADKVRADEAEWLLLLETSSPSAYTKLQEAIAKVDATSAVTSATAASAASPAHSSASVHTVPAMLSAARALVTISPIVSDQRPSTRIRTGAKVWQGVASLRRANAVADTDSSSTSDDSDASDSSICSGDASKDKEDPPSSDEDDS